MTGTNMLEELKLDIKKLISLYENSARRCTELEARIAELESADDSYRQQIAELNRHIDNLKLSGAFTGSADENPVARERLAKLIAEIDKCISLLEK